MVTKKNIVEIPELNENIFPEHVPLVPRDLEGEHKKKEEIRELAKKLKISHKKEATITTLDGKIKKASELTFREQEDEIIRCSADPIYFIETYLTIFDQTQGKSGLIVPFILFPFQRELINSYQTNRFCIANKYRQAGVSTSTCAYIAWYVSFNSNRSVAIVADKLETARDELMNDVVEFIDGCPEWLRPKTGKDSDKVYKDTQKLKRYDNGSTLGAFSSKGLRGLTPTLLAWDETAWTEKGDRFWTAAKPTLQTGGRCIMVSCVTKDTYIYTNNGVKQIKDFISNEKLGTHIIDNYNVLGKDKLRTGNLFFNNGFVDTLKIKSTYSELESSLNHKYWAYKIKDKRYGWYKSSELKIGDYISIQYGMNIWGNNDDCSNFKPTESKLIKNVFFPKKITTDIAYLLGLYLSEGYAKDIYFKNNIKTTRFVLTCGDSLSHIFEAHNLNYYFDGIHYVITSKNLGEFLKFLGFDINKKAKEKIIPLRLLEMSRKNIVAMLQGIMDGDGWAIYNEKNNNLSVGIGLSSQEMINQIRILFGNLGIITRYFFKVTKPTKKVKVKSNSYSITMAGKFSEKYFSEIGFRFDRKQNMCNKYKINNVQCHGKNNDTIPNGGEILYELYAKIKAKNIYNSLLDYNINIEPFVTEKKYKSKPINRLMLLRLINYIKNSTFSDLSNLKSIIGMSIDHIINPNIIWTKINSIQKSKNYTYDFSLPNFSEEPNEFNHSVVYNQIVTHNTPSGLDAVFYKTFDGARRGENNFKAIELWWFNDPRYNKDLVWLKNKNKETEIRLIDENWENEHRIKLMDDGWEASSPWFEEQIRDANGDMKKIAQELMCVGKDSIICIRDIETKEIIKDKISNIYDSLINIKSNIKYNDCFEILNISGFFMFFGIEKSYKEKGFKITLENDHSIIVSEDHIFLANGKNMPLKSLVSNETYISTVFGDFFVKSIEENNETEFYDIVDSEGCEYFANGLSNHNCSFLGSGDNFISEEYLKRIQDYEIMTPIRQEYVDRNMWIFEDPEPEQEYIITIDASPGHGEDNSTINVLKKNELIEEKIITKNGKQKKVKIKKHKVIQVAEYYGKITPQGLAEIVYQYGKVYNNAYCVVDITGGYGVQTVEKLLEIGYENIHYAEVSHKPSRDRLQGYIKKGQKTMSDGSIITVDLIPGFFIGNNRASVLLELQRSIHLEDIVIRSIRLLNELKTFITVAGNRVADHKRSFHDDSIMGLSIGLYVINFDMARYKQSSGVTESMLKSLLTTNDVENFKSKEDGKRKPMIPPNSDSSLNPYIVYSWLFNGVVPK
jgi:hypothetical protein